jgi:tetratricopeptide (TPR) repeat protein
MYSSNHNKAANAVKADNQVYASLQTLTTTDSAAGKYGQAAAAWVSYAKTSPSKSHRAYAWQTAASLYMSEADYNDAANGYQKSASITGLTYADAAGAAAAFVRLGNKQQGIYYLQQALRLLPANELDRGSQQQEYNQEITSLRQTQ